MPDTNEKEDLVWALEALQKIQKRMENKSSTKGELLVEIASLIIDGSGILKFNSYGVRHESQILKVHTKKNFPVYMEVQVSGIADYEITTAIEVVSVISENQ